MDTYIDLPPHIQGLLGNYVYLYIDPDTKKPFYIGKGVKGRVLDHLSETGESAKISKIREIRDGSRLPEIEILAHNLRDEKAAFVVEAAAIDLIGIENLTNMTRGSGSKEFGRMTLQQVIGHYAAKEVEFEDNVILIRINKTYRHSMPAEELYEVTRGTWAMGSRREKARYALPVFQGVTKEVYEIEKWHQGGTNPYEFRTISLNDRVEFTGKVASDDIREKYMNVDVRKYFKQGNASSFSYVNF